MKIVVLEALDWGIYQEQQSSLDKFEMVRGHVMGFVVSEDDEKIVLAPQQFFDGGVRCVLVVPKVCIINRYDLALEVKK